jgi:hypothetical protein
MTTKRALIELAYEEIGMASYAFDIQPDQFTLAVRRLNAMMAEWSAKGIRVAYNGPGGIADESGIPDWAQQAVYTNLALSLAPTIGKTVSPETRINAHKSLTFVMGRTAQPVEMQIDSGSIPAGAGWKQIEEASLVTPEDYLTTGPDGRLDFA